MNPVVSSYAFGLFFGSLLPVRVSSILLEMSLQDILLNFVIRLLSPQDWTDMDEGWLYGEWETGPWWAFHTKVKDGSRELICHILCAANLCFIFSFHSQTGIFMICYAMKEKDVGSYGWLGLGTGMRGPQVF